MGDTKQSEFFKRFQGRISKMDKSGPLGVVMRASEPVIKTSSRTKIGSKHLTHKGMKSKSLGRKEFEINVIRNARDIMKNKRPIEYESKTPNLNKKNNRKLKEILNNQGLY